MQEEGTARTDVATYDGLSAGESVTLRGKVDMHNVAESVGSVLGDAQLALLRLSVEVEPLVGLGEAPVASNETTIRVRLLASQSQRRTARGRHHSLPFCRSGSTCMENLLPGLQEMPLAAGNQALTVWNTYLWIAKYLIWF